MRKRVIASLAAVAAVMITSSAFAQVAPDGVAPAGYTGAAETFDKAVGGGCDAGCCDGGAGCCDAGCCGGGYGGYGGGWFVDFEANFMRFNQAEGVGTLLGGTPFDHEFAPRITVGVVGCEGLGLRVRYWEYDHDSNAGPVLPSGGPFVTSIDTYNLDIELFDRIDLCCHTSVEWSAGIRYNEYDQSVTGSLTPPTTATTAQQPPPTPMPTGTQFEGWGGVFGLQVNRCLCSGNFYARARWAILQSDSEPFVVNTVAFEAVDLTKMQTEIGLGYEMSRCLSGGMTLVGRVGYEWQYWNSYGAYASMFPHLADVGFDGVVLGVGLYR